MRRSLSQQLTTLFLLVLGAASAFADAGDDARRILTDTGVQGGFVVHLGCGDGQLTSALRVSDSYQVHGLAMDAATLNSAREKIRAQGVYGDVAIDRLSGNSLPYIDNLVNLLVAEDLGGISMEEVLRVLVPGGSAHIRGSDGTWQTTVKPWPDNIDEWSHYLHDPSGNAVAHDDVVGPPRHLQWVGNPRWSRHHDRMASMSALVSTNGRMFYVMDEGSRISIQMPSHWKLIARDAFNGTVLWKRDIPTWHNHLWPLKSGPTQLSRRLVSTDDEVYITLGRAAPVTAVDAATGETIRVYEDTSATEEIIHHDGVLFLVTHKGATTLDDFEALHNTGDQARVREEFHWNEEPRVVMAVDAKSGEQLWAKATRVAPLTLSVDDDRAYFHDGERLQAIDRLSGDVAWQSEPISRRAQVTFNFGPRLVLHEGVVLFAGGDGNLTAFSADAGKELWSADHPNSGYQSPQDVMVVDGLVWCAPTTSGNDTGVFTGRDPLTGEVKKEFAPDVNTYWFHHRCYIAKATDKFLIPSRTGIEFVDYQAEHWDIHHWVRGGCLYGVMPCNGLVYAPPHDCACYPEAKLFGMNALAPRAPTRPIYGEVPEVGRLERGPAWGNVAAGGGSEQDWPTYRHDAGRSGYTTEQLPAEVAQSWSAELGGRLTPPVIADGRVYVSQIDAHIVHAIDAASGETAWSFVTGGRVDSPPTVDGGRVLFGCTDGWVYCVRAADGEMVWRYRAAPADLRTMAFEQLESVWPVHGSVLVKNGVVFAVAGRSLFLDGGLRMVRLNAETGEKLSETIMDDTNPETGNNLQEITETLQGPVGLPDILSSDDRYVYMRSQLFDFDGNRLNLGPHSGNAPTQGAMQRGENVHLFAPMGFLDDSWFHRSYWVFGQSFAGGHNGYYQAGRFTPSGRLLVNGGGYVYGYGRKPEYYKWTTTIEHQLFAAATDPPLVEIPQPGQGRRQGAAAATQVAFPKSPSLSPQGKPLTVEAWFNSTRPGGVIVARGGPADGFALSLAGGKPQFHVRSASQLTTIEGPKRVVGEWHHIAGVLTAEKQMRLYIDGELVAEGESSALLATDPAQSMEVGADAASAVGDYTSPAGFTGLIDDVRLYFEPLSDEDVKQRVANPGGTVDVPLALWADFDDADARDRSAHRNNGRIEGAEPVDGRFGRALKFAGGRTGRGGGGQPQSGNSYVEHKWNTDLPIYVRAMVLANRTLYLVGPEDVIDEEETFQRITDRDETVLPELQRQDAILDGEHGAVLLVVDSDSGETKHRLEIASLPTWDGLAAAQGRLYLTTTDGRVLCLEGR